MAILKIKDPADPTGATWIDVTGTGAQGPAGAPVPAGGNPGELIVKTGPADFEAGWAVRPRVALNTMIASATSNATANTWLTVISGEADIDPDRMYHIFTGVRGIQDPGATVCSAEAGVWVGSVQCAGNDLWTTADTGLWGFWSQSWLYPGSHFTATPATLTCNLDMRISAAASKLIYSPRLYVLEY